METEEPLPGEASCHPGGADLSPEETLIRVYIAHAMQERLIEQGGLDGEFAPTEESNEVFSADR